MAISMKRVGLAILASAGIACAAAAQTPPPNAAPPPAAAAAPVDTSAPVHPTLLAADPPREVVVGWLARFVPASRGRQVYVNGDEAFWIEHQDVDAHNDLKITATLHVENFGDTALPYRSSYQVTQFDCESQQQLHHYLTRYTGNGLTGEVKKDSPLIKHSAFVGPTTLDFAHLRAVCLTAYDHIRKRPYTTDVPAQ
jgi:hypothetical protein